MFFKRRKPSSNDNTPQPKTNAESTTVAADTVFEGKITAEGDVRIEGTFRGSIQSARCTVGPNGLVEGDIEADGISVQGRVVGPLKAYHIHLNPGSHVEGPIFSQTIVIDNGAHLIGKVEHSEDPFANQQSESEAKELPALPSREAPSYVRSPLWTSPKRDSYRPLVAVRPR
jgi:cytoskeletal protein CcmA (bactofilin family)